MRCLVVYAHPVDTSYCAALREGALAALKNGGHETRLLNLYAEGFDPVLSRQERGDYHTSVLNQKLIQPHVDLIRWADVLVFVYPTWWYGLPAILKGWLDRVWVPHVAFELPEPGQAGPIRGLMQNVVRIVGITTSGATWWWLLLIGNPGRRTIARGIRALCHRRCRTLWLQHYAIDQSTARSREEFLAHVQTELRRVLR